MSRPRTSSVAHGIRYACGSRSDATESLMLNPDQIVYLNGEFLALEDARISVLDRGFIYGDGVYEVIPVYARQPFRMPHHLRRLQYSLDGIRLANPHTEIQWEALVGELIAKQPFPDQGVYLQITRGV